MMPQTRYDKQARIDFVEDFKKHLALKVTPGDRTVFERTVEPAFRRRVGRGPRSRHEVRRDMKANAFVQMFGSLQRTSQEMLWDGVGARQRAKEGQGPIEAGPRREPETDGLYVGRRYTLHARRLRGQSHGRDCGRRDL
jgi:hypothetical protein